MGQDQTEAIGSAGKSRRRTGLDTLSIIIAVVTVGVAIGALTMTGFKHVRDDMDRRFTEVRGDMDRRFGDMDRRFDGMDRRFTDIDRRFSETREDIRELRRDVNTLREAVGALKERTGGTVSTSRPS